MGRHSKRQAPIETGVMRDVTISGQGVTEINGKAVFVNQAIVGEQVQFRRNRIKRSFDEAELVEVLQASPDRVNPPCEYFGTCGGCSIQHMHPAAQLRLKQQAVEQAFARIANVIPEQLYPSLASQPLAYRRRARLGVKYVEKKGRVLVGFREKSKPYVADMDSCRTLVPELSAFIPPLKQFIAQLKVSRRLPQVELVSADNGIGIVIRVLDKPTPHDLKLFAEFQEHTGSQIWLQPCGLDSIDWLDPDHPGESLNYRLPDFELTLEFGPLDFIQVNGEMNGRMLAQAMEWASPKDTDRVLDLYCGIGNFSLPLARRSAEVTGVEIEAAMVSKATSNAALNGITNARFIAADLSSDQQQSWLKEGFDLVVLDPPRTGASEVISAVAGTGASRILYVSCHPGTLARDAGMLVNDYGYRLTRAGAMDMFPQTSHVEAMALFEKG